MDTGDEDDNFYATYRAPEDHEYIIDELDDDFRHLQTHLTYIHHIADELRQLREGEATPREATLTRDLGSAHAEAENLVESLFRVTFRERQRAELARDDYRASLSQVAHQCIRLRQQLHLERSYTVNRVTAAVAEAVTRVQAASDAPINSAASPARTRSSRNDIASEFVRNVGNNGYVAGTHPEPEACFDNAITQIVERVAHHSQFNPVASSPTAPSTVASAPPAVASASPAAASPPETLPGTNKKKRKS